MEKKYTSEMNYNNPKFTAGCVFTEKQWVAKGGKVKSLEAAIAKGYITEWEGQAPPVPMSPPENCTFTKAEPEPEPTITVSASPLDESEPTGNTSEDSVKEEESVEEVVEEEVAEKTKPEGIWNFKSSDLEPLPIEALNTMYKDHASKKGLTVRAYKDKDALIMKMCSEAAKEVTEN